MEGLMCLQELMRSRKEHWPARTSRLVIVSCHRPRISPVIVIDDAMTHRRLRKDVENRGRHYENCFSMENRF